VGDTSMWSAWAVCTAHASSSQSIRRANSKRCGHMKSSQHSTAHNSMQRRALRAAADAGPWVVRGGSPMKSPQGE
jgi:hypothetical protein